MSIRIILGGYRVGRAPMVQTITIPTGIRYVRYCAFVADIVNDHGIVEAHPLLRDTLYDPKQHIITFTPDDDQMLIDMMKQEEANT